MFQVYISSTYEDLKEYRKVAASAARRLELRAVAMEDYVASDERPLDKCLADVRDSHAYVGIIAWRYGYIPDGYQKSITHLEYEAAKSSGIPSFIFLLEADAEWPDHKRDPSPALIEQFRTTADKENLRGSFRNIDSLDAAITAALSKHLRKRGGGGKINIPALLPYMADRSVQRDQLADALSTHRKHLPRRPFVSIVHGDEREAHRSFVERLEQITFPRLLRLNPDSEPVHLVSMEWAARNGSFSDRKQLLQKRLANSLTGRRESSDEEIAQAITKHQCPVMISSSIFSEAWRSNEADLVKNWFEYWERWPDLPPGQMLLIVLSFTLKDESRGSFLANLKVKRQNKKVCAFIDALDPAQFDSVTVAKLEKLEGVNERHVVNWIENEAGKFIREAQGPISDPIELAEKLKPWVREQYKNFEAIPMEALADQLREQLRKCMNKGGN